MVLGKSGPAAAATTSGAELVATVAVAWPSAKPRAAAIPPAPVARTMPRAITVAPTRASPARAPQVQRNAWYWIQFAQPLPAHGWFAWPNSHPKKIAEHHIGALPDAALNAN